MNQQKPYEQLNNPKENSANNLSNAIWLGLVIHALPERTWIHFLLLLIFYLAEYNCYFFSSAHRKYDVVHYMD